MITDAGKQYILKVLTGQLAVETIKMGLYVNTVAWSNTTNLAGMTEPTQTGYARQLTSGWGAPTIDGALNGDTTASAVTFSDTDATPIVAVGFFYVTSTTNVFLGGAPFAATLTIPATVGTLTVTPELQDNTY